MPPLTTGYMTSVSAVADSTFTFAANVVRFRPSRSAAAFLFPPALRSAYDRRFHSKRLTSRS